MESVNSLRISAPQWWPLREGRDGKCEGRNEKCEFLTRESVSSSPIVRIFAKWKWDFIANFSTKMTSLPSLSLSLSLYLSLSLSLSHRKYLTHNIGSASALPIICPLSKKRTVCTKYEWGLSQTSTVSKVCQEQCLSSDLHTCLIRPPQTMNGLPSNSTGSSPAVLLHLRRREDAFRSPRNTSAGAYVKADNDCCIRPMMESGWRLERLTASCRSLPFHRRIQT